MNGIKTHRLILAGLALVAAICLSESLKLFTAHAATFTVTATADNGNDAAPTPGSTRPAGRASER